MLKTEIVHPPGLEQVVQALKSGQVIAMPTETVYGLAGDAFNPEAVSKIFAAKERPKFDPLIVHLAHFPDMNLKSLAAQELIDLDAIPHNYQTGLNRLIQNCWPGPLTLVLPRHSRIPDLVTSGLSTVALRVPQHPVAQQLLKNCPALAAPSANRFGRISPTNAQAVWSELSGRIPWIVDGGPCEVGVESSIVGLSPTGLELLRSGKYSLEEIQRLSGLSCTKAQQHPAEIKAPGMLKSHYAPSTQMTLFSSSKELLERLNQQKQSAVLFCFTPEQDLVETLQSREILFHVLAPDGRVETLAQNLFADLRALDQKALQHIFVEFPAGEQGLAYAVRDRLSRAAYKA